MPNVLDPKIKTTSYSSCIVADFEARDRGAEWPIFRDPAGLLTAISGYSDLALSRVAGSDPKLRAEIEQIARAAERAAELTRQLLAFSRRQTLQTSLFDLNEAVSDSETLLRRVLGSLRDHPHDDTVGQIAQLLTLPADVVSVALQSLQEEGLAREARSHWSLSYSGWAAARADDPYRGLE